MIKIYNITKPYYINRINEIDSIIKEKQVLIERECYRFHPIRDKLFEQLRKGLITQKGYDLHCEYHNNFLKAKNEQLSKLIKEKLELIKYFR